MSLRTEQVKRLDVLPHPDRMGAAARRPDQHRRGRADEAAHIRADMEDGEMTREEAIEILNTYDVNFHNEDGKKIRADKICAAFDMAVKALEREQRWIPVARGCLKNLKAALFAINLKVEWHKPYLKD